MFLKSIPFLTVSSLSNSKDLAEAAQGGIFYLEIPHECREFIDDALKFCYRFPHDEGLKKYNDGKFGGYHPREHDQIESFYVERKDWKLVLPENLQQLAGKMDVLAKEILQKVLLSTGIPRELWQEGTGNLTNGEGQNHFSYNHYRSEKQGVGIKSHRDFGFVSILFIEKTGLEAHFNGEWREVPPLKDHFVVILGRAFEILVNDVEKVSGAWHRVGHLSEERASFAVSCDNNGDSPVKRYQGKKKELETVHPTYQNYLQECFKELYSPNPSKLTK